MPCPPHLPSPVCRPNVTPQAILDGGVQPLGGMKELYDVLDRVRLTAF